MKTSHGVSAGVVGLLGVGLALVLSGPVVAQVHQHSNTMSSKKTTTTSDPNMMKHCQAMADEHQKMMADMKTMDAELDRLVATMNATTGAPKVDAAAAAISQLAAQRMTMHANMWQMQSGMSHHMMEHMSTGTMAGMQKSMAMCPMMKGTGRMMTK